ncbi:MAG: aminopeptidase P family protein [Sinobacteraceae bacterium]|nr:aminopeptidase P family protein [Nevskiaceae bacterium]
MLLTAMGDSPMIDRRSLLTTLGAAAAGVATSTANSAAASAATPSAPAISIPSRPDVSFLRTDELVNRERAQAVMTRENIDAFVVTQPTNVFYLGNHWPNLDRMGFRHSVFVIYPRDPQRPVTLVMSGFLHYYRYADDVELPNRIVFPYTMPEADGSAAPTRLHRVLDESLLSSREKYRRKTSAGAEPPSPSADVALQRALRHLGLTRARLAIDDPAIERLLGKQDFSGSTTPAEDHLRRIRLAKSPAEIRLMRIAAQHNVDAAMAMVATVRTAGSTGALRNRFFAEAAARGNQAVFIVIDGSSSEIADAPIRDGMAFSIDCVSSFLHYHGDFARTIFVGEPHPLMRRGTSAIFTAWQEVRSQLRPGMRFVDVQRIGRESMKKQGADFSVNFTPHSVGLWHSDHPQPSVAEGRSVEALVLEKNMVLSVDCPIMDTGMGGTCHLEDLVLIGEDGATPIHSVPPNILSV